MFDTIPDKEDERWLIEGLAERYREKCPIAPPDRRRGHALRRRKNLNLVAMKLARLQQEYDHSYNLTEFRASALYSKAVAAVWPLVMPYRWPLSKKMTRFARLRLRENVIGQLIQVARMAVKVAPANYIVDYPIVTVRRRKESERSIQTALGGQRSNLEQYHASVEASEIIGRAVLREYRRHPEERRSLESAYLFISSLGIVDGIQTGSKHNVRKRYLAFRTIALERGYADSRAFWCEYEQREWPIDQVWMQDFPVA